jgi:hypothetical protein
MRENFECYTVQDASGVTMAWLFAAMTSNVTASAANSPRRKRAGSERLSFSLVDAASGLLVVGAGLAGGPIAVSRRPGGHRHSRATRREERDRLLPKILSGRIELNDQLEKNDVMRLYRQCQLWFCVVDMLQRR